MTPLLHLTDTEVATLLTPDAARASQRAAFEAVGRGEALVPERLLVPGEEGDVAFCYAARTNRAAPAVSKFGAVHQGNAARGLPAVHALVTVLDAQTGAPACIMAATSLTTLRTAAASAVAVEELTPTSAVDLAIVGAGVQAEAHARAICAVRPVRRIRVVSRDVERTRALASRWAATRPEGAPDIEVADSTARACEGAQIVALCTTSSTPVVEAGWILDGALVITVGSFSPDRAEVPSELMADARVVVDDRATASRDNGSVVQALDAHLLDRRAIETLGEVLVDAPQTPRRPSTARVTVYASVGIGVQDAAAAAAVLELARDAGIGTHLTT